MKRETSFAEKLRSGWNRDQLMEFYAMSEREYDKVIDCLASIEKQKVMAA